MADGDLREKRQGFGVDKLAFVQTTLRKLEDENDDTPLKRLAGYAELTITELKKHHRYADHFLEDFGTYGEAVDSLRKKCFQKLRDSTIAKLRQVGYGSERVPSLKAILRAAAVCEKSDWLEQCDMRPTWASDIRHTLQGSVNTKMMKTQKSKKFLRYLNWVQEYLQTNSSVPYEIAKKQHKELIGPIGKWSNFSKRVRVRLDLITKSVKNSEGISYMWIRKA